MLFIPRYFCNVFIYRTFAALNQNDRNNMSESVYFSRRIDSSLTEWKDSPLRKPLLLRGARQVGKSSAVRHLSEQFEYFVEVNFEIEKHAIGVFEPDLYPDRICSDLESLYRIPITDGKTLLFLDEVQACPRAISALRFFYEKRPGLHVIAAGSLLEFALAELPSFGVGRIQSMYIFPFNFAEFLHAANAMMYKYLYNKADYEPLTPAIHNKVVEYFKTFMLIGGMPEVVRMWLKQGRSLLCHQIQADIIATYTDDFAKYKTRIPPLVLRNTWQSVAEQAGSKFVYSAVQGGFDTTKVKEALELLQMAGLIIPVTHTSANGVPFGAQSNPKFRKFLPVDTGIMLHQLGLNIGEMLLLSDTDLVCKGGLAEVSAGLELLKNGNPRVREDLYYWLNLHKDRQAEIDYLFAVQGRMVPVEVKAGTRGSMQSLYYFLQLKDLPYGIRTSMEPFGEMERVHLVPLYALGAMRDRL